MAMTNAEWMIKNGYKFKDIYIGHSRLDNRIYEIYIGTALIDTYRVHDEITWCEVVMNWLDMEHKEQILDDAEKRYLSAVIRPFRNSVNYICKIESIMRNGSQFIKISTGADDYDSIFLPFFASGTMYKGMEAGKHYTLEKLGL